MRQPIELWGGIECTVNRVGGRFADQTLMSGHETRIEDLERFAALGITALRYPVLWERVVPDGSSDWRWSDERLPRIRELKIRPIVGLVHHGSGPRCTNLLDPAFPDKLAAFAQKVAERYPWIDAYTPVNEPLTTARFSCLYGHWYPHRRDMRAMLTAQLNQIRGIVAAMRAIRKVNPAAALIQTDDLGRTLSTPQLDYQARHENERRWLTFDMLTGRVGPDHALWPLIADAGLADDFARFRDDLGESPCPPDLIGLNHYLSSERFLDHRLDRYPPELRGGNGHDRYVDVLALRVLDRGAEGPAAAIKEAWARYGLPLAITEIHNGCTREEQMRWFADVWRAANAARRRGIDIRAGTAWALLGSFDWDRLLTQFSGHYEPGVFDIRTEPPHATGMVGLLRSAARGKKLDHPVLDSPGWWHRPDRLHYPAVRLRGKAQWRRPKMRLARPIVIVGATGTLGRAFARLAEQRGLAHLLLRRSEFDIADEGAVQRGIEQYKPWVVVNAAGFVRVDEAEANLEACRRENELGPRVLAEACSAAGVALVSFSSDLVFNGAKTTPYVEDDPVGPLNVYGATKAAAEQAILERGTRSLVIRTSAFFGPWDPYNFVAQTIETLRRGELLHVADDVVVSPTYVPHLVHSTLDLLIDGATGLWHLANEGEATWAGFADMVAHHAGLDRSLIRRSAAAQMNWRARRPPYSALGSKRGRVMPPLQRGLEDYFARVVT